MLPLELENQSVSLREHGLGQHLELAHRPHNADDVELVHELALGLLEEEVPLDVCLFSVSTNVSEAEAEEQGPADV